MKKRGSSEAELIVWHLGSNQEGYFCKHNILVNKYCTTAILKTVFASVSLGALYLKGQQQNKDRENNEPTAKVLLVQKFLFPQLMWVCKPLCAGKIERGENFHYFIVLWNLKFVFKLS